MYDLFQIYLHFKRRNLKDTAEPKLRTELLQADRGVQGLLLADPYPSEVGPISFALTASSFTPQKPVTMFWLPRKPLPQGGECEDQ